MTWAPPGERSTAGHPARYVAAGEAVGLAQLALRGAKRAALGSMVVAPRQGGW